MNQPTAFNFPNSYRGDGMKPWNIKLKYTSGDPINLTGCKVKMQLKTASGELAYSFGTEEGNDSVLTVTGNEIQFPEIKSWKLKPETYSYDLKVTDPNGYVTTYMKGTWTILKDITS